MASNDLGLSVTADVTDLRTKLALASADAKAHGADLRKMAADATAASGEVKAGLMAQLGELANAEARARAEVAALRAEMAHTGEAKEFNTVFDTLKGRLSAITNMGGEFREFGELLIAAFAVERIADFIGEITEAGAKIQHLSETLGIPAAEVSKLGFTMKAMGSNVDEGATVLERLERSIVKAGGGAGPAAKAFADLGINSKALKNASPEEALNRIADAFHRSDGAEAKIAIAMATMGRGGAVMIPVLNKGSAGIREMNEAAERAGSVISGPMAEGMERTSIATFEMHAAVTGLSLTLYEAFKPAIDAVIGGLTEMIEGFNNSIKSGFNPFHIALTAVVIDVDAVVAVFEFWTLVIKEVWEATSLVFKNIADLFKGFATLAEDVFSGHFGKVSGDYHAMLGEMHTDTVTQLNKMAASFQEYTKTIDSLMAGVKATLFHTGGSEAPPVHRPQLDASNLEEGGGHEGHNAAAAAARKAAEEIAQIRRDDLANALAIQKDKLSAEEQELDAEVASGKITNVQKIEAEKTLTAQMHALDVQRLQSEMATMGLSSVERNKVNNEILKSQADFSLAMEKLNRDMADAMKKDLDTETKDWEKRLEPINRAFDGMVQGILQGTQTLSQTMARLAQNIAVSMIEAAEKSAVKWLAKELAQTAATQAGTAARVATQASGAAAGRAIEAASGHTSVLGDAHKAFAGAYAAVSGIPIVGPFLAPAAGAAAFAAVAAMDVFSAEGGMGNVPYDNAPFLLHKNEMVLPAGLAETVRNSTTNNGGATFGDIHIHQQPGQDGADMYRQIKRHMLNDARNGGLRFA